VRERKKLGKRKWRKSEKIVFSILIFAILVFVSAIVFAFINKDSPIWAYLITAVGALASSAFAVFAWKEKNENLPKILNNPNYDREQLIEQVKQEMEEEYRNLGK